MGLLDGITNNVNSIINSVKEAAQGPAEESANSVNQSDGTAQQDAAKETDAGQSAGGEQGAASGPVWEAADSIASHAQNAFEKVSDLFQQSASIEQTVVKDGFDNGPMKNIPVGYTPKTIDGPRSSDVPQGVTPESGQPGGQTPLDKVSNNRLTEIELKNGELTHPGDFNALSKLGELLNPRLSDKGPGPGQRDPMDLLNDAGRFPSGNDGKNVTSKTDQQSAGEGAGRGNPYYLENPLYYDWLARQSNPSGGGGGGQPGEKAIPVDQAAKEAGMTVTDFLKYVENVLNEAIDHMSMSELQHYKDDIQNVGLTKDQLQHMLDHPDEPVPGASTPTPDAIDPNVPDFVFKMPFAPIGDAAADQHRRIVLPGEGRESLERMRADLKEALAEGLRQRTDGRIDSPDGDGTTENVGGGPRPEGSGIEQVDGKPKKPPGDD